MERKRKNTWLPYGGWITKILEYCGFNLEDEEIYKDYIRIGNNTIRKIRLMITKWVLTNKPHKENLQFWRS